MKHSDDDSTGKGKFLGLQERNKLLFALFCLGLCGGMMISERVYITGNLGDIKAGAAGKFGGNAAAADRSGGVTRDAVAASIESDPVQRELYELLKKIAPTKEVLVGVSNKNPLYEGMLETFIWGVENAGVTNYVIAALDKETEEALKAKGKNVFYIPMKISKSQAETGENHAVSSLKFGILKRFLQLGWAVLLSDLDVSVLQNPFNHLYRDSDVEGMSDGFDRRTAYGTIETHDDQSMGWARWAQYEKRFNLNSGLFYLPANVRTIELMRRLEDRLSKEKYWDQTAYNEEIFFPSHGSYKSPGLTVRVMLIYKFMNSKVLFKDVRNRPLEQQPPMPVMVHINYHPDKHPRMKAVFKYYLDGDKEALKSFPGGSEPGS